jgi:hypothetical protein
MGTPYPQQPVYLPIEGVQYQVTHILADMNISLMHSIFQHIAERVSPRVRRK